MLGPDVLRQFAIRFVVGSAHRALERTLRRMRCHMCGQVPRSGERLPTNGTLILLLALVDGHVLFEAEQPSERFRADFALEGLLARVDGFVLFELIGEGELLVAHITLVRRLVLGTFMHIHRTISCGFIIASLVRTTRIFKHRRLRRSFRRDQFCTLTRLPVLFHLFSRVANEIARRTLSFAFQVER